MPFKNSATHGVWCCTVNDGAAVVYGEDKVAHWLWCFFSAEQTGLHAQRTTSTRTSDSNNVNVPAPSM